MRVNFQYANGRERMMSRRDANILQKLGRGTYMTRDMRALPVVEPVNTEDDALTALRAQYQDVVGKRPFHGWDADTLRQKIAEAGQDD
jgi:hypothetical protein